MVTICLQRRESIHPAADSITRRKFSTPRNITNVVGKEFLLYRCPARREFEEIVAMDLPFVLFIPFGKAGLELTRRLPPASLQLPNRTAETCYELVVTVHHSASEQRQYLRPIPLQRFDTLSTFGMFNRVESYRTTTDHLVTLDVRLPRTSYGPSDPVTVQIQLLPNLDYLHKARRVTIQKVTIQIEEEVVYNHEGDEPQTKTKVLQRRSQTVNIKMPDGGWLTSLGLVFPHRDLRDSEGFLPCPNPYFPMYAISGFTTIASLYKIDYYLLVKAHLTSAKDIVFRQRIIVCPFDHSECRTEMESISKAAVAAQGINPDNPKLPGPVVVRVHDRNALDYLQIAHVRNMNKPIID